MIITGETIDYVAALAKIQLSEEERLRAKKDLGEIIGYMERMNELDTTDVEPMSHAFPLSNVFREDEITNGDEREAMLLNAPNQKDGYFVVPKTVE
ncbi:MAG: Asp-tRNA(Asn)/Glu-tRNA(Gln) amidotransferase subunit GatC [Lachnospiraceae bacterium]|nr:Asp-tRNA(Asn)/Glu-tRNA(Gln) amidotransferase subunit GatC [Lachnospiraceae bacterium]